MTDAKKIPENPFQLGKPMDYAGAKGVETISEVALRAPTFAETEDFGPIFSPDGNIDFKVLKRWVMRLSGLTGDAVRQLPMPVMYRMATWIANEILPPEISEKNSD